MMGCLLTQHRSTVSCVVNAALNRPPAPLPTACRKATSVLFCQKSTLATGYNAQRKDITQGMQAQQWGEMLPFFVSRPPPPRSLWCGSSAMDCNNLLQRATTRLTASLLEAKPVYAALPFPFSSSFLFFRDQQQSLLLLQFLTICKGLLMGTPL